MPFTPERSPVVSRSVYLRARALYWDAMCALMRLRSGRRIWSGPFAGTKYRIGAVCSASVPKLIGTYERELQPEIEKLANERWSIVIDVGAAEGYYAVGFARRLPGTRVLAYEMDPSGRELLRANAEENQVTQSIDLQEECTASMFADVLKLAARPVLVVMDVEGAEADLIGAASPSDLSKATFVIEVHDFNVPPGAQLISSRLQEALGSSHEITVISSTPRSLEDFPSAFSFVPPGNRMHAMDEYRPTTMQWMVCRPRT